MNQLTKKQSSILSFIKKVYKEGGYIPSVRDIAANSGLSSPATVWEHIQNLIEKGYLKRERSRYTLDAVKNVEYAHVRTLQEGMSISLPLLGSIVAGSPIESWEERGETISVPADLVKDPNSYVLRVRGDSMIEDGILEGDYVIVERNFYPKNGDVVVALLDNAYATLKKFFRETNRIRLQPANSAMAPIYAKDIAIQGIVRAIIRKFA